jgi:hypothetical protein
MGSNRAVGQCSRLISAKDESRQSLVHPNPKKLATWGILSAAPINPAAIATASAINASLRRFAEIITDPPVVRAGNLLRSEPTPKLTRGH